MPLGNYDRENDILPVILYIRGYLVMLPNTEHNIISMVTFLIN